MKETLFNIDTESFLKTNIEAFASALADDLEYSYEYSVVEKVNETLHGVILDTGSNIRPCLYVDGFFDDYRNDRILLDEAKHEFRDLVESVTKNALPFNTENITEHIINKEYILNNVFFSLCNTEKNKEFLKDRPHFEFLDLSIYYRVGYPSIMDRDVCSCPVDSSLIEKAGVSEEELRDAAERNNNSANYIVESMVDVLKRMLDEDFANTQEADPNNSMLIIRPVEHNYHGYGAAAMLNNELLKSIHNNIDDFYILPSSVHELLVFPVNASDCVDSDDVVSSLKDMVTSVNQACLREKEILSDNVYFYDGKSVREA